MSVGSREDLELAGGQPKGAKLSAHNLLAIAVAMTGTFTPTAEALAVTLVKVGGPTLADVLAWGWMVPTVDKKGLRWPPVPPAGLWGRSAPAENLQTAPKQGAGPAPLFSLYRGPVTNLTPCDAISPAQFHRLLTSDRYRAKTEALRAASPGSPQRAELKKQLDYVTPAGTFARRANSKLENSSGLLVFDFDHVPDLPAARAALMADAEMGPSIVLLFTSPSGDGLKAIVEADPNGSHLDNFRYCEKHLTSCYADLGLTPDKSGKDVARACFVSYDPAAWIAPAFAY